MQFGGSPSLLYSHRFRPSSALSTSREFYQHSGQSTDVGDFDPCTVLGCICGDISRDATRAPSRFTGKGTKRSKDVTWAKSTEKIGQSTDLGKSQSCVHGGTQWTWADLDAVHTLELRSRVRRSHRSARSCGVPTRSRERLRTLTALSDPRAADLVEFARYPDDGSMQGSGGGDTPTRSLCVDAAPSPGKNYPDGMTLQSQKFFDPDGITRGRAAQTSPEISELRPSRISGPNWASHFRTALRSRHVGTRPRSVPAARV